MPSGNYDKKKLSPSSRLHTPVNEKDVFLRMYDLSNGHAAMWAPLLMDTNLEGVWHTSIYVFSLEYFYSGYINYLPPDQVEREYSKKPVKILYLGRTDKKRSELTCLLKQIYSSFTPKTYDLVNWNCNHFSDVCSRFLLNGTGIPPDILNFTLKIQSTFMGNIFIGIARRLQNNRNPFTKSLPGDSGDNSDNPCLTPRAILLDSLMRGTSTVASCLTDQRKNSDHNIYHGGADDNASSSYANGANGAGGAGSGGAGRQYVGGLKNLPSTRRYTIQTISHTKYHNRSVQEKDLLSKPSVKASSISRSSQTILVINDHVGGGGGGGGGTLKSRRISNSSVSSMISSNASSNMYARSSVSASSVASSSKRGNYRSSMTRSSYRSNSDNDDDNDDCEEYDCRKNSSYSSSSSSSGGSDTDNHISNRHNHNHNQHHHNHSHDSRPSSSTAAAAVAAAAAMSKKSSESTKRTKSRRCSARTTTGNQGGGGGGGVSSIQTGIIPSSNRRKSANVLQVPPSSYYGKNLHLNTSLVRSSFQTPSTSSSLKMNNLTPPPSLSPLRHLPAHRDLLKNNNNETKIMVSPSPGVILQ